MNLCHRNVKIPALKTADTPFYRNHGTCCLLGALDQAEHPSKSSAGCQNGPASGSLGWMACPLRSLRRMRVSVGQKGALTLMQLVGHVLGTLSFHEY